MLGGHHTGTGVFKNFVKIPGRPTWNHLAVTLDEYNNEVKFYKNGENTDTFTPNPFVNIPMTTTDLTIGNNFTGELDNVMIHKGVVDFTVETQLYTVPDSLYTPQTITTESWTHVAAVYNKEQNMVSMYQDGQHTGSFENYLTDFTAVGTNSNSMFIGTTGDSTTFYDGILDDVRVYKSALTTEDIGELYAMYDQNVISYIDKTNVTLTFVYDTTPVIDIGTLNVGSLGDAVQLGFSQQGGNMGTQILDNGYTLQFTWITGWQVLTTSEVMVNTSQLGAVYEFEYKEQNQGSSGYMVLGFDKANNSGTGYSSGGESTRVSMLLNWHGTISRWDTRNTYATGTGFENESAKCEFWRFTVVEETNSSGQKYNDILYEGFTNEDRTPGSRTIYGLASRMYHGGTISNGQTLFTNYSEFYLVLGGHHTGTGVFKNFKQMKSLRYYAFAMDTNRLSGKQDMQYFIDNIDSIPTNMYKTVQTYNTAWDVGTLNKVISSDLVTEADVSLKTSVYVYVIAQNTNTYEIDYYKQQIPRTFEPVSISSIDAEIVGDNTQITILSGTAISIKQYYIFAFNGQVTQEEVISFAKTRLNVINETGMTNINGHDVYSYKVPGSIPTPGGYNIPTNIVLSNAFYSVTNVTAPIPVSGLTPFTTYLVGYDNSGSYYVNTFGYTPVQGVTTTLVEQSVTYEMNLPTTVDGITLNTGTLVVGTQKAINKIVLFAFAGVEPSEDEVVLFYQDNIRNLSVSTEYVYINTTGFNLGQTIDLSTLGVSVTSVFNNLSGSSTEAIVDGGEYYVIMLLEDINDNIGVNSFIFFTPYNDTRNVTYIT